VRISCVLNETIEKYDHLITFKLVFDHDIKQLISTVLKEKDFSLEWVSVEKLVSNLRKRLNHKIENVLTVSTNRLFLIISVTYLNSRYWIYLFETLGKESNQVTSVEHISR